MYHLKFCFIILKIRSALAPYYIHSHFHSHFLLLILLENISYYQFLPMTIVDTWRRKRQPPPVFLPGKSHGQRSLAGYSPWHHKDQDTTEQLHFTLQQIQGLLCSSEGKESACNTRHLSSVPGLGRSSGEGNEWPLTTVFLTGESMDRGAWQATVCGGAKSWTQLTNTTTMVDIGDPSYTAEHDLNEQKIPMICDNKQHVKVWIIKKSIRQ